VEALLEAEEGEEEQTLWEVEGPGLQRPTRCEDITETPTATIGKMSRDGRRRGMEEPPSPRR
jgi:hypothetical protein